MKTFKQDYQEFFKGANINTPMPLLHEIKNHQSFNFFILWKLKNSYKLSSIDIWRVLGKDKLHQLGEKYDIDHNCFPEEVQFEIYDALIDLLI